MTLHRNGNARADDPGAATTKERASSHQNCSTNLAESKPAAFVLGPMCWTATRLGLNGLAGSLHHLADRWEVRG